MRNKLIYIFIIFLFLGCGNDEENIQIPIDKTETIPQPVIERPNFSPDSAYTYIQQQVDFGPRFPNNDAHGKCAIYLEKN